MHLPEPTPEPACPVSPEPPARELLSAQLRIAGILARQVGGPGASAEGLARQLASSTPPVASGTVQWAICKLIQAGVARLVVSGRPQPSPFYGDFVSGPVGIPMPVRRCFVSFEDQVIAPTDKLYSWVKEQERAYSWMQKHSGERQSDAAPSGSPTVAIQPSGAKKLTKLEMTVVRLREETLANGEHRTFGQVAAELNRLGFKKRSGQPYDNYAAKAVYKGAAAKK